MGALAEYRVPPSGRMYQVVPGPEAIDAEDDTVIEVATDFVWTGFPLSLTFTVKFDVPTVFGVPEITPVVAASVSPAGRFPDVIDHVYAGVPPLACNVRAYAVPSVPDGNDNVVIVSELAPLAATAIDSTADAVCAGFPESVTRIVKLEVPLATGVPEITPVDAASVKPRGRAPDVSDQVYAPVPPVAARGVLYTLPTIPEGTCVVETTNGAVTGGTFGEPTLDAEATVTGIACDSLPVCRICTFN